MIIAMRNVSSCAGFWPPALAMLTTRSGGRRAKSAKARNRGGGWYAGSGAGYGDLAVMRERRN
jgi:hypothetical protein